MWKEDHELNKTINSLCFQIDLVLCFDVKHVWCIIQRSLLQGVYSTHLIPLDLMTARITGHLR